MKYFEDIKFTLCGHVPDYRSHICDVISKSYTVEYIAAGRMYYQPSGQDRVVINGPAVHWHLPGRPYCYGPMLGHNWDHYFVNFVGPRATRISMMMKKELPSTGYMSVQNGSEFEFQFRNLLECVERETIFSHAKAVAVLENILAMLCMEMQLGTSCPHQRAILQLAENICSMPEKYHSLDQLAGMLHLSRPHFCRLFKQYTGRSAYDYILSCKMRKAANILRNSEHNITETARLLGYDDLPQFSKLFLKQTGVRPRDIIKNNSPISK